MQLRIDRIAVFYYCSDAHVCFSMLTTRNKSMMECSEVTPPPPVSSRTAERLSKDSQPNWLSKARRSNSKSVCRSGRGTTAMHTERLNPYCRSASHTRRLHGEYSLMTIMN